MVRPKLKQLPNKNCKLSDPDTEECVKDGWVVVKKQRVTILIPPLPVTKQCVRPNMKRTDIVETPSEPIATKEAVHIKSPQPDPPLITEKTMSLANKKPVTTFSDPLKLNHRATPENRHSHEPSHHKKRAICGAPKGRNHMLNGHMLVNSNMRALNLERKLKKAGGLNSWLVSLGLEQFVKIFRCKRVSKVQLANLTMKKLKDMGADAVGPRRKLMHAIDCLW